MRRNKRIDDLKEALKWGKKRNGNHLITVSNHAGTYPTLDVCRDCSLVLACVAKGGAVSAEIPPEAPCLSIGQIIDFHYHDTCCLSANVMNKRVTDHGMWGYSVTTSRAIRWYLQALLDIDFIEHRLIIDRLCKLFKKRPHKDGETWLLVNIDINV